ncbi:chromosome segregation protein SMC [Corynebacterium sp. CCM 9186]|uniref:chromosome segregation protein SMC n=1 Tax=Corynebacterium meridianum TaxID=2765363 RepID=UPI002004F594|nr:chromosome segregation protein SMC [Corynebacterium meridianum]
MHLKSLTLKGFKSFASATTLKFEPGICAVVGPNGSGKSNVVDALAWVMGEQGAKTLRGGKMEDVIFAGAGDRKPLGRAEVTLTIDNADGALDIDYSEVSVTRRMFRDGASEYEINGTRARLMDIQELLSDSGIGREMHVIVGQGRLAQILEAKPEDRRAFIEEAAGVLKHRRRKEKAHRKLVGMQANLDRLTDLTGELKRQLKPLARQAEAAKRAATVQAELRDARLRLAGDQLVRLRADAEDAEAKAELLAARVREVTEQLEEATGGQLELEEELARITPEVEAAQNLWFTLSALAERVSATVRIAADRAANQVSDISYSGPDPDDLARRAERADEELAGLEEAVEMAAERLESIRGEVEDREQTARELEREHLAQMRAIADRREGVVRLLAAEESQRSQIEAADADIERLTEQLEETLGRADAARAEAEAIASRIESSSTNRQPLEQAHTRASAEAQAAEARLDQLRDAERALERRVSSLTSRIDTLESTVPTVDAAEVLGEGFAPLATLIRPEPGTEKAVAAALGPVAEAVAGDIDDTVLGELDGADIPRTTLIDTTGTGSGDWRLDSDLPTGCTWLLDHLDLDPGVRTAVVRLLVDVVLADDDTAALQAIDDDPRLKAVTRDGTLRGHGWLTLGQGAGTAVEITAQIDSARGELTTVEAELSELAGTLSGATTAAEEARVDAAAAKAALREHDRDLETLNRDAKRLVKSHDAARAEHQRMASRVTAAELRRNELAGQLEETLDRLTRVEDTDEPDEPSTAARDEATSALAQVKAMEVEARLALRTAEERAGQLRGKGDALRRQAEHERQAKARHERAMAARRAAAELAAAVARGAREVADRTADATARAAVRRDELNTARADVTTRLARAKDAVNAARMELNRLTDTAHASDIARSQAQVRIEQAEEQITGQLGLTVEVILADYTPGEDFDRAAEKKRLKRAEKDLASLGKVNPLALEEFKALEERYEYLATQLSDVEQARRDLTSVIEEVDAKILQLFTDAWRDVEDEFPRVFSTLFPGGEGRLVLTDPDEMLTTGIEVEARPPGKRVKRLSLLSGGEKSLTALAMLVAIFRARPSPFYVMDEVEAALDDVNLRRLINLFEELRESSQLIVITHQKPTMDVANVLYGVTMRGDGVTRVISQRMSPATRAQADTGEPGSTAS